MVELKKAKELNNRLDAEIRELRCSLHFLNAEKNSVQHTVRRDKLRAYYKIN